MHTEDAQRIESALAMRAASSPEHIAVVDGDQTWSWAAVAAMVAANAARLRAHGMAAGDRAVVFLDKRIESVVALYAIWTAGGIAVPVHEGARARQLRHVLDHSGASVLVTDPRLTARLEAGASAGVALFEVDTGAASEPPRPPASHLTGGRTPAALMYTSGSTGRPKGITVTHQNLIAGARIVSHYLGLRPDDRVISVLPFSFDYGMNQLLTVVRVGATLVLQRSHFAPDICRTLLRQRVTVMAGVPTLWIQLMDRWSPFATTAFPDLRLLTNSGGAFPQELVARYRAHLPHARIFLMYGLSEAFRSTFLPPDLVDEKPGSIGKAIPETEVEVVVTGADGSVRRSADGEAGELMHRGPTVALGYWNDPQATAERFRPDPFTPGATSPATVVFSGDLVRRDRDGFLFFVGRRDQMIKTHGHRVSPEEVEEILHASGLVREAVVRGEPDPVAGFAVVAHVVPTDATTFSADELLAFCRREMPSHMVPKAVHCHQSLPRTGTGKVDRGAVGS